MAKGWRGQAKQAVNRTLTRIGGDELVKAQSTARFPAPLPPNAPVRIVTATTSSLEHFHEQSYLGRSLASVPKALRPEVTVFADNGGATARGLTQLYNQALTDAAPGEVLVLVHDDVYLHDWHIVARAREAVTHFDIAGIAGALEPDLGQPSWWWSYDENLVRAGRQSGAMSGSVNHGDPENRKVMVHGALPRQAQLVDGVLMIVHADRVRAAGARFDEDFRFHFYDIDFCRTATAAGLRVGTWPISITHLSRGSWDTESFADGARRYLAKWS